MISGVDYQCDKVCPPRGGLAETRPALQCLIDIVFNYNNRWCFEANVKKCAVVKFSKTGGVTGTWVWGNQDISTLDSYCYLGVEFSSKGCGINTSNL